MTLITHFHTHTFPDGKSVKKSCTMSFKSSDDPNLKHERESTFTHPDTGETHIHRFVMKRTSKHNDHSWSDDTEDGYDSEDVDRYISH